MRYLLLFLAIFSTTIVQAKMYKWVDENGRMQFSDKPPTVLPKEALIIDAPTDSNSSINRSISQKSRSASEPANQSSSSPKNFSQTSGLSSNLPSVLYIQQLLEDKQYQLLNSTLEAARIDALSDLTKEQHLMNLYLAFEIHNESYLDKLNSWVNAYPASYQPFLARAIFQKTRGWTARGKRWASETSEDQRSKMNEFLVKSRTDVEKALRRNPNSIIAYVVLIDLSHVTLDLSESEKIFEEGLKVSPASYLLRKYYIRRLRPRWGGSYQAMLALTEESLLKAKTNPKLVNLSGWILEDMALSQISNGNYSLAIKTLDEGLEALKNSVLTMDGSPIEIDHFLIYSQANAHYRAKNYAEALRYIDIAINQNNNIDHYYNLRSKINFSLKDYIASANDLEIALRISPFDKNFIYQRDRVVTGLVYEGYESKEMLDYPKSLQFYNAALSLKPNDDSVLRRRAYLYIKKSQIRQAKQDVDRAIEIAPLEYDNYKAMDDVLLHQRRFAEIVQYWDKYIELKPSDSRAFYERSGTYFHLKRLDLAMKDAKQASALGHPNADALYQSYQTPWSGGK